MKMSVNNRVSVTLLSLFTVASAEARTVSNYSTVKTQAGFDKMLAKKKHTVVWFYDSKNMAAQDYTNLEAIYNKVADVERYEDKKDMQFLAVDTSTKQGRAVFQRYNEMNDTTMVDLPAILLFKNGKMVNNQISGNMNKERIKAFIQREFPRVPKEKKNK